MPLLAILVGHVPGVWRLGVPQKALPAPPKNS